MTCRPCTTLHLDPGRWAENETELGVIAASMVRQRAPRRRRQQSVAAVVLTALLRAIAAAPFWAVACAMAAGTPTTHLSPASATYGATVSIHAAVYDDDGNPIDRHLHPCPLLFLGGEPE